MNFIKAQLEKLGKQLEGLGASQKMLAAALVAIMVMTLFFWGRYASSPEMEAVLDQSMSLDEIGRIRSFLSARGFEVKVAGDRVTVPAERKMEALSELTFAQLLPRDTADAFDTIVTKMSPWDSAGKQD